MDSASYFINYAVSMWAAESYIRVVGDVKENLRGKVLRIDTGRLINSIDLVSKVAQDGFVVGTNVHYGIAWEKGFTRKAFIVSPKRKKALKIPVGGAQRSLIGKSAFTDLARVGGTHSTAKGWTEMFLLRKWAKIPAKTFPARPFLRPAITGNLAWMNTNLQDKVGQALKAAFPDKVIEVKVGM